MTTNDRDAVTERASNMVRIEQFPNLTGIALNGIRHIYGEVPATRESLALLFAVDAAQTHPTEAWIGFFVETACAQLIWDERPTGTLSAADAAWVLNQFDEAPRLSLLALLVRMIDEAARMPVDFVAEVRRRATQYDSAMEKPAPVTRRAAVPYLRLVA